MNPEKIKERCDSSRCHKCPMWYIEIESNWAWCLLKVEPEDWNIPEIKKANDLIKGETNE